MLGALRNTLKIPELKQKLLFTAGLLAVYRLGAHVPAPGVDLVALRAYWANQQGLLGMFNMFSGNALRNFSLFAMGIMPYINASIIIQLLTVVIPQLEALAKEGPEGRKKITQYTRYGTVVLAAIQAFGLSYFLAQQNVDGRALVPNPDWWFYVVTVISLTAGTAFIMWLGEQITERGVGNGISLIIFAGIVAGMLTAVVQTYSILAAEPVITVLIKVVMTVALIFVVTALTVIMTLGQRRVPIQQAKRIVGRKVYGGASHFLPLRVNFAGVIPVIFASALMMLPTMLLQFLAGSFESNLLNTLLRLLQQGSFLWNAGYVVLIVFFTFFYTAIVVNPVDMADNMKKNGSFIPGVRPGKATAEYIERVLTRITLVGALFLAGISILPQFIINWLRIPGSLAPFLGGTALLIIVGVALDTLAQIESHLAMRHYGTFLDPRGKGRGIRGR